MSKASELLNSLSDKEIKAYSAGAGASEAHITISYDRVVRVPEALKKVAVEHDHNVETVTFDCPRYWDGLDMSTMRVYINYKLSNGYTDSYPAEVTSSAEDIMNFSWTISANVTQVKGPITFLICIKKTDSKGVEVNHWNSELCKDMYVAEGMECQEGVPMEYSDLVNRLLERMDVVEQINVDAQTMQELLSATETAAATAEEVKNEALDASNYIKNSYAPAIKGNVSGEIVRVDDVSPIQHTAKVKVHGENIIPFPYKNGNQIISGAHYTINDDGSVRVTGVATNISAYILNAGGVAVQEKLEHGVTYELDDGIGKSFLLIAYADETGKTIYKSSGGADSTFTWDDAYTYMHLYIQVRPNKLYDMTLKPGLYKYVDKSTVKLEQYGKNMFDISGIPNNSSFTNNGNTITIKGGVVQTSQTLKDFCKGLKVGQQATLSFCTTAYDNTQSKYTDYIYLTNAKQTWVTGTTKTITQEMLDSSLYFYVGKDADGNVVEATISCIQLEIGDKATPYEPYSGVEHEMSTDGLVDITSVSPTMTVCTDTDGLLIDLEYNRDTTKTIAGSRVRFSNGDTITLVDNVTYYSEEEISDLTVLYPNGNFIGAIEFTTPTDGTINISLPANSKYIGEAISFGNDETWELNIKNGVVVGGMVV